MPRQVQQPEQDQQHYFIEEAGPASAQGDAQGDGGRVEDDEDMADLVDYFIGGD